MKHDTLIGGGLAVYWLGLICIQMFGLPKLESFIGITLFGAGAVGFALFRTGFDVPRSALVRWSAFTGAFIAVLGLSCIANLTSYDRQVFLKLVGYLTLFLIASTTTITRGIRYIKPCFIVSWLGLLVLLIVILAHDNRGLYNGRLLGPVVEGSHVDGGLQPNDVGQIAMCAFCLSPVLGWRGVAITFPVATYSAYLSNSRGALLGMLLAFAVFVIAREFLAGNASWRHGQITLRGLTIVTTLTVVSAMIAVPSSSFIFTEIFKVGDSDRGVGSGLTGRTDTWETLIEQWREKPFFGHGYGVLKNDALSADLPLDGGYVMLLAELGVIGLTYFVVVIAMTIWTSLEAVASARSPVAITMLVYSTTFCVINLLQSRIVGAGSIGLGIFFLISGLCVVDRESVVDSRFCHQRRENDTSVT